MTPIRIFAPNAVKASDAYCRMRDDSGEGASTFPCGAWRTHHISYNGRVWQDMPEGERMAIYNPGFRVPDIWVASTDLHALAWTFMSQRPDLTPMSLDEWLVEHDEHLTVAEYDEGQRLLPLIDNLDD